MSFCNLHVKESYWFYFIIILLVSKHIRTDKVRQLTGSVGHTQAPTLQV